MGKFVKDVLAHAAKIQATPWDMSSPYLRRFFGFSGTVDGASLIPRGPTVEVLPQLKSWARGTGLMLFIFRRAI